MTKQLEKVFDRLRDLPDEEQDRLAGLILDLVDAEDHDAYQLTDEQIAEVERRRADPGRLLSLDELDEYLRVRGLL